MCYNEGVNKGDRLMDLAKIGKFIKEMRKAKGLTQMQLAEKLMLSEKTISKWECGNGFPDATLILPLCKELDITANELLSGKTLKDNEYKDSAEQNIVTLQSINQKSTKLLLTSEIVVGVLAVVVLLGGVLVAALVDLPTWARILMIAGAFVLFIVAMHFSMIIEKDAGLYECKLCKHKYIPTLKQMYLAQHMGRTRYMKCPHCGKRSWQHKVID